MFWLRQKVAFDRAFSSRHATFESAGTRLTYTDDGDGPVVVLVHGIIGDSSAWNDTVKRLRNRFRLLAIDYRGQGGSDIPGNPDAYGLQMVDDIAALLTHTGVSRACVIGASAGAEMALRLAVSHPQMIDGLVLIGSGWSREQEANNYRRAGESIETHGSLVPWIKETGGEGYFDTDPYGLAMADLMLRGKDLGALAATFRGMVNIINLSEAEIRAIDVPVLGICGEHDIELPCLERMTGVVPDYTFKLLPGQGHMDTDEDPDQAKAIDTFLEQHLAGADG